MWFKVVLLVLSLSQLELGAAQQCEGFVGVLGMTPDQLIKGDSSKCGSCTEGGCGCEQWQWDVWFQITKRKIVHWRSLWMLL